MASVLVVNRTRANAEALASAFNGGELQLNLVATHAKEARSRARAVGPDVALLELDMAVGLKLVRDLQQDHPAVRVVVYGSTDDERELAAWAEAGAVRIVMRAVPLADLVRFVCETAGSGKSGRRAAAIVHRAGGSTTVIRETSVRVVELTQRERDVLRLIAAGLSNRDVADTLCVELPTVKNHVQHLMKKLGVHRRSDAAEYWHKNRVIRVAR
jgi:DNA-binding NarL/FixJ family response regulator